MELQKPDYLLSLATSSLVVNVDVRVWSATKQDKRISGEVTDAYKASRSAGKFTKNLLADDPTHKKILLHRQSIYNWNKRRTYDWAGDNRILPFVMIDKYKQEWREFEAEHTILIEEFKRRYPDIIAEMAFKQGDMFDSSEYPSVAEIGNRFSMHLNIQPVAANDFRCAIAQDIADDLKQHYERCATDAVRDIMRTVGEQLTDLIKRVAHACSEPEEGKRKPKVYDSTLNQVKELCSMLEKFNVTKDEVLDDMRKDAMRVIGNLTADDIRDSDAVRATVKDGMDDILSKFNITLA
jgi:hypothetical protein